NAVRPGGGDLHVEPRSSDEIPERSAGGVAPRELADGRRRRARAVRRHPVERLRPARAGPRGDGVLHRDGYRLRRSVRERVLVTGALGCIGAWTCALLAEEGTDVVGFDFGTDDRRLRLVTDADVPLVQGDIVDTELIARLLDEHEITHVIYLAA